MSALSPQLEQLYASFSSLNMEGGWHRRFPALWPQPRENFLPHTWHYADVRPILDRAGDLVDTEFAERRNLTMFNPVEGNIYSTVRTIVAAYQMVKPGEVARAHRHTPNALRMILEGRGTYTVVDGKEVEMRPGDVLLTPNWCWHAHENKGAENCYWMDFLDVPLVHLLEPMFYEPHPDGLEQQVERLDEAPIAFRFEETCAALADAQPSATHGMLKATTLGPAQLATLALDVIEIEPGQAGLPIRETANAIYAVMRGSGELTIGGTASEWRFGDTVAVPAWREHSLRAGPDGAMLLKVSDRTLMQKLGWYRHQAADGQ
ncbi:MAG: cupin domain-containing protein [Sphingomonadales bacterium]|nr:cupin domain-containing protein [Sphingomonadales bacterium]MBD3772609.1 cupin domain-containing protein [Paracoccaceae bacterium]